jgi:hypothetical protein
MKKRRSSAVLANENREMAQSWREKHRKYGEENWRLAYAYEGGAGNGISGVMA